MTTEKICTKCGIAKPLEDFHKHKRNKDGLQSRCKACILEQQEARNAARKDQRAEYQSKYREENGQALNARRRAYQQANRETLGQKRREYMQNYREANREAVREASRKYKRRRRAQRRAERLGASAA